MGILERIERIHRAQGLIETICMQCQKPETIKLYDTDKETLPKGSFTIKCGCGVTIFKFHNISTNPDPNHTTSYFTKAFIASPELANTAYPYQKQIYDPEYKKKNIFERNGYRIINGKYTK